MNRLMNLLRIWIIIFFSILIQTSAFAQFALADGDFASDKTNVRLLLLDADKGVVAASVSVGMAPCSGAVTGIGKVKDRRIEFGAYESISGGGNCKVTLEFDGKWNSIKISDNGECLAFHGASCTWDRDLVKRKKR